MAKFQKTRGRANRAMLVQNFSKLAPVFSSLVPHPDGSAMQVFEFVPSSASQATSVAALAKAHEADRNLWQSIQADWELKCQAVNHADQQPIIAPPIEVKQNELRAKCQGAGRCLHHCEAGQRLLRLEKEYLDVVCVHLGRNKPDKHFIVEGKIVVRMCCQDAV